MAVATIAGSVGVRPSIRRLRLEHFVMGGAIVCLIVLVVLPLGSLLLGSVRGEHGLSLENFAEVVSGRLYVNALKNSLILGAWTGLFSLVIGVSLAWAVSRTDVPGKSLIQLTASLSYLSPPFLTAIAFVYLFSPNAGLAGAGTDNLLSKSGSPRGTPGEPFDGCPDGTEGAVSAGWLSPPRLEGTIGSPFGGTPVPNSPRNRAASSSRCWVTFSALPR